jgi:hypothetical protein
MPRKTRINALHSRRLAAVEVFSRAANDLQAVAADYHEVAAQAYAEASDREQLAAEATVNARAAGEQAAAIRKLLG